MSIKKKPADRVFDVVNIFVMLVLIFITLYPFLYIIFASLSNSDDLIRHSGMLMYPLGFNLNAYKMVFKNPSIFTGYGNTLFILVVGTSFNLLLTSFGAYVLSRKGFPCKRILLVLIVFTMYFNGGMIPRYLLINNTLKLGNNLLALILPQAISTYNFIVMRTSFLSVPDSLEESAKIDGANDFVILFKIVLPVSMSVVAVMILFYGVAHWNAWFDAMIFLRDRQKYPLQLILREILILNSTETMTVDMSDHNNAAIGESIKYATIMVATLPVLVVYPFLQKYFVKGVMIGAVKG